MQYENNIFINFSDFVVSEIESNISDFIVTGKANISDFIDAGKANISEFIVAGKHTVEENIDELIVAGKANISEFISTGRQTIERIDLDGLMISGKQKITEFCEYLVEQETKLEVGSKQFMEIVEKCVKYLGENANVTQHYVSTVVRQLLVLLEKYDNEFAQYKAHVTFLKMSIIVIGVLAIVFMICLFTKKPTCVHDTSSDDEVEESDDEVDDESDEEEVNDDDESDESGESLYVVADLEDDYLELENEYYEQQAEITELKRRLQSVTAKLNNRDRTISMMKTTISKYETQSQCTCKNCGIKTYLNSKYVCKMYNK